MSDLFVPTDEQRDLVKDLVALGCPQDRIAKHIGISIRKLSECFGKELELGLDMVNRDVMLELYQRCMNGDTKAIIFWLKSRAGWSENQQEKPKEDEKPKANPFRIIVQNGDEQRELTVDPSADAATPISH